jgi:hypothetical protein
MDLQSLLVDEPGVHEHRGRLFSYGLPRPVLEFIDRHVDERSKTIETGAGLSTILFATKGASHICICPAEEEIDRIKDYCKPRGISLAKVEFRAERSDNVLPTLEVGDLDIVLIDGCHGFPTPFLDWYYLCSRLKVDGMLIIDDVHLWTGRVLKEFLLTEPEWKLIEPREELTAIFQKRLDYRPWKEWDEQPYVMKRSPPDPFNESKFRRGLRLLRQGKLVTLARQTAKQVRR